MKKNMGALDRYVRLGVAGVVVLLAIFKVITGVLAYVLIAVAVVFVLTSIIRFCPLYLPFRINTNKKEQSGS